MTFFYYSCILLVIGVDSASIFCLIHTATPSHATRAHTILETWAKRCDDFMFFTDSPMSADIPHIYWKELHSRDHSWEKIRRIFNHVVDEMEDEYDWYLRADDDAYVIVENLRHFLANYSSKEPHYFGYRWNFFVPHGYADGGVYVLSRPAVEVFNRVMEDPKLCPELHRAEEDQEMGRCLAAAGIYPEDTRDENGSDRHALHHLNGDTLVVCVYTHYVSPLSFSSGPPTYCLSCPNRSADIDSSSSLM